jgi:ubiquinone biosynthesis UbiH/UbiF/VisC/COQ6 family hydroxylase
MSAMRRSLATLYKPRAIAEKLYMHQTSLQVNASFRSIQWLCRSATRCNTFYQQHQSFASTSTTPLSDTTSTSDDDDDDDYDVVIVGGGIVGCALARWLGVQVPSLRILLVDASRGPPQSKPHDDAPPLPRSYALSPASLHVLGLRHRSETNNNHHPDTHVWNRLGRYKSMQIWEANQPASLVFQASTDLMEREYLGVVAEDAVLHSFLWKHVKNSSCNVHCNATITNVQLPSDESGLVTLQVQSNNNNNTLQLASTPSRTITARLLVGADGANSAVRAMAGIPITRQHNYKETALTFTVELAASHHGRAFQRFLNIGILALLPTFSETHAIVVWSTTPELANSYKDNAAVIHHLNELLQQGPEPIESIFGLNDEHNDVSSNIPAPLRTILNGVDKLLQTAHYGPAMAMQQTTSSFQAPPRMVASASPHYTFPLYAQQAAHYTKARVALCGDAAHVVHPMAGQGLNLGLNDVSNLVFVVQQATEAGMDPSAFLGQYEAERQAQVQTTVAGIHALHELFAVQGAVAKHVKSAGMNLVQSVGPIRRRLAQAACHGIRTY